MEMSLSLERQSQGKAGVQRLSAFDVTVSCQCPHSTLGPGYSGHLGSVLKQVLRSVSALQDPLLRLWDEVDLF